MGKKISQMTSLASGSAVGTDEIEVARSSSSSSFRMTLSALLAWVKGSVSWTTLTLTGGFSATTIHGDEPAPGYYKDPMGIVHLRGCMTGAFNASNAFILPSGYRPAAGGLYPAVVHNGSAALGYIRILADGTAYPPEPSGTNKISLNGISFPAA